MHCCLYGQDLTDTDIKVYDWMTETWQIICNIKDGNDQISFELCEEWSMFPSNIYLPYP